MVIATTVRIRHVEPAGARVSPRASRRATTAPRSDRHGAETAAARFAAGTISIMMTKSTPDEAERLDGCQPGERTGSSPRERTAGIRVASGTPAATATMATPSQGRNLVGGWR